MAVSRVSSFNTLRNWYSASPYWPWWDLSCWGIDSIRNSATRRPIKLQNLATNAVSNIERPSAEELRKTRVPRDGQGGQYFARVDQDDPPDPQAYAIKPWAPPMARPGSKREDPAVFAPLKLETTALVGPLCIRSEGGEKSLLADLKYAPAPEKKERVEKKPRRRAGGGGSGSGSMSWPEAAADAGWQWRSRGGGQRQRKYDAWW